MTTPASSAPWRARLSCALSKHILQAFRPRSRVRVTLLSGNRLKLTDHLADDVGLTPAERAQLDIRLPSQGTRHLML